MKYDLLLNEFIVTLKKELEIEEVDFNDPSGDIHFVLNYVSGSFPLLFSNVSLDIIYQSMCDNNLRLSEEVLEHIKIYLLLHNDGDSELEIFRKSLPYSLDLFTNDELLFVVSEDSTRNNFTLSELKLDKDIQEEYFDDFPCLFR